MTEIDRRDAAVVYNLIGLITNPEKSKATLDKLIEQLNVVRFEAKKLAEDHGKIDEREKDLIRREKLIAMRQTELDVASAALVKREETIREAEKRSVDRIAAMDQQARDMASRVSATDAAYADADRLRKAAKDHEAASAAAQIEVERRLARIKAAAA